MTKKIDFGGDPTHYTIHVRVNKGNDLVVTATTPWQTKEQIKAEFDRVMGLLDE